MTSVSSSSSSLSQLLQMLYASKKDAGDTAATEATQDSSTSADSAVSTIGYTDGSPALSSDAMLMLMQLGQGSFQSGNSDNGGTDTREEFGKAVKTLTTAINSGDLTAAKAAYKELTDLKQANSAPAVSANGTDPFQTALDQIGDDLESGDLTAAQNDVAALQPPPRHGQRPVQAAQNGNAGDDFRKDLATLIDAIQSGDTDAAKDALKTITDKRDAAQVSQAGDTARTSNSAESFFDEILDQIGTALNNNDIEGAQQDLAALQPRQSRAGSQSSESIKLNADGTITITKTNKDGTETTSTLSAADTTQDYNNLTASQNSLKNLMDVLKDLEKTLIS